LKHGGAPNPPATGRTFLPAPVYPENAMKKLLPVVLLLAVFVLGCAPSKGIVTDTRFIPEEDRTMLLPQFDAKGNFTHYLPIPVHHPARYMVKLKDGDKEGWREVSSFYGIEKGEFVDLSKRRHAK
jgi:hypothetical protein